MMKRLLLLALLLQAIAAAAQRPGAGQRPGGSNGPLIGRVYGRVLDGETRKGAEYTTIAVRLAFKDSIIGGGISRGNGDFSVDKLPAGPPLKVSISFIGFKTWEKQVQLSREKPELDLGNITLEPNAEILRAVEVTGERAAMVMQVDRRVFNVEKDLSTQGGTGVDVMKNVPGLSVDLDGNVQMRGANPQVLVNGRPSAMTLEQIPAEDIEKVEVITNPSVAFDANATGGIINVVLKKSTKPGYNGQVQAGIGTNGRYQAGASLNMKEGRWAFNLSYNFNTGSNVTNGSTQRTDRLNGAALDYFNQDTRSTGSRTMNGGRFGVEWQASNRNLFSASAGMRGHGNDGEDLMSAALLDADRQATGSSRQANSNRSDMMSWNAQAGYRRKAMKEGRELTADLTYNSWNRRSDATFGQYSYDPDGLLTPNSPRLQHNLGGSHYDQLTFQTDWTEPLGERDKLEFGAKANWKLDRTYIDAYVSSPAVGSDVLDTSLTNDYAITDIVNAAYVNWMHRLSAHWSLQGGFRFEQTWFETELLGRGITYSYKYPDGTQNLAKALFPALYLSRKWDNSLREVQLNVSRKISRPNGWQMMPFVMNSDSRNIRIGNPALAPELSTLVEANHLLPFLKGKATWLTSVFGRHTQDVITGYAKPLGTDSSITVSTFINGSYSATAGWENIVKLEPRQGLQLTLSGTLQYTDVALSSNQGGTRNQGTNWNAKAMVSYRLLKDWAVQLNGEYESPRPQPQGRTVAQYGADAQVSHDLTKRLSAVLAVNDVFYTRRWGNIIDTPNLYQESWRRREMRYVRFTLTWRFGETNTSLFRRRDRQRSEPGSGQDDMGL